MYRLYSITKNQDETEKQSIYEYDNVTEAEGNFELKKGQAMADGKFAFLMLLDNIGKIHDGYITKVGEGTITPRLFEVKTTDSEVNKVYPQETNAAVSADFYKRLGGAKLDSTVRAIMLRGIGANGEQLEYAYWVRPIEQEEPTPEPEEVTE
jgi:hypothetical protein